MSDTITFETALRAWATTGSKTSRTEDEISNLLNNPDLAIVVNLCFFVSTGAVPPIRTAHKSYAEDRSPKLTLSSTHTPDMTTNAFAQTILASVMSRVGHTQSSGYSYTVQMYKICATEQNFDMDSDAKQLITSIRSAAREIEPMCYVLRFEYRNKQLAIRDWDTFFDASKTKRDNFALAPALPPFNSEHWSSVFFGLIQETSAKGFNNTCKPTAKNQDVTC